MKSISVIIPSYQHASTIARCLDAVFTQSLKPSEVIIVNDGSTDNTLEVLKKYEGKIKIINQENLGGQLARNNGFAASTGDFVIFCDADVVMRYDMLEKLCKVLEAHPEASYAYSGFRFGWKAFSSFPFDVGRIRKLNFVHTTALIRREHFPGFDPTIKRFQDWDLWLTMMREGHIGFFVDEELFHIIEAGGRQGISKWRPKIFYHIPWKYFGWMPSSVRKYEEAKEIIAKKHGLE
ncbi:MAG: glycosyltransferase family A protein [Patescibacteria group bacterium]|jgi:glycosyltransferase involved in cell wall biosynthesis